MDHLKDPKSHASATLLWSKFAQFHKVMFTKHVFLFFFNGSITKKKYFPISIYSGLGGDGFSFFSLGQYCTNYADLCHFLCLWAVISPPHNSTFALNLYNWIIWNGDNQCNAKSSCNKTRKIKKIQPLLFLVPVFILLSLFLKKCWNKKSLWVWHKLSFRWIDIHQLSSVCACLMIQTVLK